MNDSTAQQSKVNCTRWKDRLTKRSSNFFECWNGKWLILCICSVEIDSPLSGAFIRAYISSIGGGRNIRRFGAALARLDFFPDEPIRVLRKQVVHRIR